MKNFNLILISIFLIPLAACDNKPKEKDQEPHASGDETTPMPVPIEIPAKNAISTSGLESDKKEKSIYDATDTIFFGDLQIIILGAEERKVDTGANAKRLALINGGPHVGLNLDVTIKNTSKVNQEMPFVSFQKKNSERPFQMISRMFFLDKSKKLFTEWTIAPGKTIKGRYVISGLGNPSIIRFTYEDKAENEKLDDLIEQKGNGGMMSIVTDEYDGWSAFVNLKSIIKSAEDKEQ